MSLELAFLLVFVLLFVALLVSPLFLSRQKAAEEKNLTALFEESCAVRRDFGSGSSLGRNMFLWRVTLYPEFMVLALFSQAIIPYREIERVEIKNYQDYKEVWIRRRAEPIGELISVRTKNAEKMVEVFTSSGIRYDAATSQSGQGYSRRIPG